MPYHHFTAKNRRGIEIDAWYIAAGSSDPQGTVLFCHNHGANKGKVLPYARFLNDAGYNLILFDFSNHGNSGKDSKLTGALKRRIQDIECVVEHALALDDTIKIKGVVVMGFSLGCVDGIRYANRCPYTLAVILDSGPPFFIRDIFARLVKRVLGNQSRLVFMLLFFQFRLLAGFAYEKEIQREIRALSPRPVFFIHGDRDTIIPDAHTRKLYCDHARAPKEYWFVRNCFHLTAHFSNQNEYETRVIHFLSGIGQLIHESGSPTGDRRIMRRRAK